ncbi:hypothetical protein BDM02DRAFT_3108239 [Thelephora ganbajun]|uniref:Uncharacterized protein n=1 Tax=Thelephora ganbajun TaxID=370292 RepID=A0ACB6ZUL5_THEGA|nr:hypothetical protein BDM02DRAFT_3108239 [Thelephora ganbajun]
MCHNIIDGRFHSTCGHFVGMSTRLQDCNRPDCLFSRRHEHPVGCKSHQCRRMMSLPVHNPIRLSDSLCGDCIIRNPLSRGC